MPVEGDALLGQRGLGRQIVPAELRERLALVDRRVALLVDEQEQDVGTAPGGRCGGLGACIAGQGTLETCYTGRAGKAELQGRAPVDIAWFAHGLPLRMT